MSVDSISQENTILVVDDTPTNLQVLFDLLSEQGYRVAIAFVILSSPSATSPVWMNRNSKPSISTQVSIALW
jgi:hypothetical protein